MKDLVYRMSWTAYDHSDWDFFERRRDSLDWSGVSDHIQSMLDHSIYEMKDEFVTRFWSYLDIYGLYCEGVISYKVRTIKGQELYARVRENGGLTSDGYLPW